MTLRVSDKPTIPEVIDRLRAYCAAHPDWGVLGRYLGEGDSSEGAIVACSVRAIEVEDTEGYELSQIVLRMSTTQRKKLFRMVRSD